MIFPEHGKVPDVGKIPDGPMKRCNVLVFEMCSSIKISFALGKNKKGPALNELVLGFGYLAGAFLPLDHRDRGRGMVCCGFWMFR